MAFRLSLHPSTIDLETFASHADEARRGVGRHLARCVRCQNEVRSLRALRTAAHNLPLPAMSPRLFEAIARRAALDELVLLPPAESGPVSTHRRRLAQRCAVAAAVVVAAWIASFRGGSLVAGETVGELTLTSRAPNAPSTIEISYRPTATLADLDSVIVTANAYKRGMYFSPTATRVVARRADARFVGEVTLPPEVGLAVFVIASPDGKHVDDNDGRSWEIIVRDSTNRPRFDGLEIAHAVHSMDDWERAYAAAKEMVRLYPDEPAGVRALLGASLDLAGPANADSVRREFAPSIGGLHRRLSARPADAQRMWEMTMLGQGTGDTTVSRAWFERIKREYPRDAGTIQLSVFAIFSKPMSDVARLRALDDLWDETGGLALQLASDAFNLAVKLQDPVAIERWGDRFKNFPGWGTGAAVAYAKHDALRAKGKALLRTGLAELPPVVRTDWIAALRERPTAPARGQWMLASLGEALFRDGKFVAARDSLRRAATVAWSADVLASLGTAALAAGDTSEASHAFAWAVADRRTSAAKADSLRAKLGAWVAHREFRDAESDGRTIIREMALAKTFRRPFNASATFVERSGSRRSLSDALAAPIAVIAVISPRCAPSIADMPSLQKLRDRFAPAGVPVVAIIDDKPNDAAIAQITGFGYTGPIGFDDRSETSRALRQYGTPAYFLVENGKTILAQARRAGDFIALIEALQGK